MTILAIVAPSGEARRGRDRTRGASNSAEQTQHLVERGPDDKSALGSLAERVASWEGVSEPRSQPAKTLEKLVPRLFGLGGAQDTGLVLQGPELARFARLQQERPDWICGLAEE